MAGPTTAKAEQLCRLTVLTESNSADVALPVDIPIVELIPPLVSRLGDPRLAADGAVIQRWGDEPLDENRTASMLGLHDGETVFLRPRSDAIPAAEFDDLVDAITSTTGEAPDLWRAANTRTLMRLTAVVPLVLTVALLLTPGPSGVRQIAALTATLLTGATAAAAGRGFGDRITSLVLACTCVGYAGLFGAVSQAGPLTQAGPAPWLLTPPAALAGGAAMLVVSLLLFAALADFLPILISAAVFGFAVGLFGLLAAVLGQADGAAAVVLALGLAFAVAVPMVSFRLARLQLPSLPDSPEAMNVGVEPLVGTQVIGRIRVADACVTGLLTALAGVSLLCVAVLGPAPGWAPSVLIGLAAALQLMRSRLLRGTPQRLPLLVSGIATAAALLIRLAVGMPADSGPFVAVGISVVLAVTLLMSAVWMSTATLAPYWGRAAEILEWLLGAAVVPVAAAVLGLYGWAHGLGG